MCGRGHVWQGGVRGSGGGHGEQWGGSVHGRGGHAWQGGMHCRGVCMAGEVCMAGGVCGRGACVAGEMAIAVGGMHPTGMHSCQIVISTWDNKYEIFINLLLLSATVVAERLCFQRCLSTGGVYTPTRTTPLLPGRHPLADIRPGRHHPLPKMATVADGTVRILLECILVLSMFSVLFILNFHLNEKRFTCCPSSIKLSHFSD